MKRDKLMASTAMPPPPPMRSFDYETHAPVVQRWADREVFPGYFVGQPAASPFAADYGEIERRAVAWMMDATTTWADRSPDDIMADMSRAIATLRLSPEPQPFYLNAWANDPLLRRGPWTPAT